VSPTSRAMGVGLVQSGPPLGPVPPSPQAASHRTGRIVAMRRGNGISWALGNGPEDDGLSLSRTMTFDNLDQPGYDSPVPHVPPMPPLHVSGGFPCRP